MFGFFKNPSREKFVQMVQERIRERNGQTGFQFSETDFSLHLGSRRIFLENLYADYCAKKEKADREIVLNNIADFARPDAAGEDASFNDVAPNLIAVVRERLLVSLANVNWGVESFEGKKVPAPVHEPISRWFLRTLVIDAPTHMAYVNEDQLRRWNLTFDEAYALALANLQAATIPKFKDEGGVYLGQWGDAYDASRILVPGIFDDLPITGEPVFVLPNRDTLLVTDSSSPATVQAMLERAEQLVREIPRPQNIAPLVIRNGAIQDYEVPPESPAFAAVDRARRLASLAAYGEQKAVLEKVYERNGKDIYVGEHTLTNKATDAGPEYRSYCVWSRGVPTLLPVADDLVLYDPDQNKAVAHVPWQAAVEALQDLMLDTQMYPPRYYVSKFPSSEKLSQLGGADPK
jgi:hypothetical protein